MATLWRLTLLISGSVLLLLLGAAPVLADGGPHVATINSGTTGISADSCAGCHRAHTSQGEMLLREEEPALCLTCHGASGTGATTDVMSGIQYSVSSDPLAIRGGAVLGALRSGGFAQARIDSGNAARLAYLSGSAVRLLAAVPVLAAGQDVTSTHMNIDDPTSATVWGNGAPGSGAGGTTELTCTGCHNPHGNGMYRILNPIPTAHNGNMSTAPTAANVDDAPLPVAGDQRNYTVIQRKGTEGNNASYLLYASQVASLSLPPTAGDYFHRRVPWNASSGTNDAPNGKPSTFDTQINAWCSQCHTRYLAVTGAPYEEPLAGDSIFTYRHSNTSNKPCTTCHVAHGSNAQMTGTYSASAEYPGGAAAPVGDSRLLKIDNRGTCQACHDPTGTITAGTYTGPVPTPAPIP